MNSNLGKSNAVSLFFQFSTLLFTCCFIAYFIYKADRKFCSIDPKPDFFYWTENDKQKIIPNATNVNTGLIINDFSKFDVTNNEFIFKGLIWFEFDPSKISLDIIKQFSFERGEILHKSKKPYIVQKENRTLAKYEITVAFKTNLNYKYFPFDDHTLYLTLLNRAALPSQMVYVTHSNNFITNKDIYLGDWKNHESSISDGYISDDLKKDPNALQSAVLFKMAYARTGFRYIIVLFLPLFFIFFMELLSFVVSLRHEPVKMTLLQVSASNIAALFAYRFVVETVSPKVGYFLTSDYLFFIFLTNSLLIYIINSIGQFLSTFQKEILSILLQLGLLFTIAYLLNISVAC